MIEVKTELHKNYVKHFYPFNRDGPGDSSNIQKS